MSEENKNTSEVQEEINETPVTEEETETDTEMAQEETENTEETDASTEEQPAEGKTKTSFFGKKKKEKDKKDQQIDELTDRLKRNMAEFDNFRKRTEKEKASMYIIGAKEIVEKEIIFA